MNDEHFKLNPDPTLKTFSKNCEAISDLINVLWFDGNIVVHSSDIIEANPELSGVIEISQLINSYLSYRDILFKVKVKHQSHYFGIENSQNKDYTLGIRICRYDFFSTNNEYDHFTRKLRQAKKEKRKIPKLHLTPVHTVGLYWGAGRMKSNYKLSDYMESNLYPKIENDMSARIVSIEDIDTKKFQCNLNREVFKTVQEINKSKGDLNVLKLQYLSIEAAMIVAAVTNCPELLKIIEEMKKEEIDMNEILEKLINNSKKEGLEKGKLEIAKAMKENGEDISKIAKYTLLNKELILAL